MKKGRTVRINRIFVTIVLFLFVIMIAKLSYIVLSPNSSPFILYKAPKGLFFHF